jgi:hypothetical protein
MKRFVVVTVTACIAATAIAQHKHGHDARALDADPLGTTEIQIAPVLEGLGSHHHEVTTSSERAQTFFDQGMKLTYAFNHQEARRSCSARISTHRFEIAGHTVVVSLGITGDGTKVPLGLWLGSTENAALCTSMLPAVELEPSLRRA